MGKGSFRVNFFCPFFFQIYFPTAVKRHFYFAKFGKQQRKETIMIRTILAVIVGFCVWSILWVGGNELFKILSPGWYGASEDAFMKAMANKEPMTADSIILLIHLGLSVIVSFISGYITALVAGENKRSPLSLGVVLLMVGVLVEAAYWSYIPVWYHLVFLVLLIPVTVAGGRLRRVE